jgi:membrane protein implicated in regulation of membrane protease activity
VDLVDFFANNHANMLFMLAGLSLVLELTVLGLSGPLLFLALGLFITGILSKYGVVSGWQEEAVSIAISTLVTAFTLWGPLKSFQNKAPPLDVSSDLIGRQVRCVKEINATEGNVTYSGVEWSARLEPGSTVESIPANGQCIICRVDGNKLFVKPASSS